MKQDHIIQKVFVEITVNNKEKAFGIKEEISSFLSMDIFPEIEKYINALEYKMVGETLQIPRLELNLDIKNSTLNAELKDKIAQLFKEELSEATKNIEVLNHEKGNETKAYLVNNEKKLIQTFIHFLEKGYMPWWNSTTSGIDLLEPKVFDTIISADNFEKNIIPVLSKQTVRERIINQLSDEQIAQFCLIILKNKELKINLENDVIRFILKLNDTDRMILWRLILNIVTEFLTSSITDIKKYLLQKITKAESFSIGLSQAKSKSENSKMIAKIFPFIKEHEIFETLESLQSSKTVKNNLTNDSENPDSASEKAIQKKQKVSENLSQSNEDLIIKNEGQYVQNAGLILIHPFIKTFFEHCDLWDKKTQQLADPELCAHLLHYIATGNTNAPEYDMIFEKFLCNIPMNQTINRHIKLSRKHKIQAKKVIESVQHNWNPMKKSSAALLQNEFFQRSGKLVVTDRDFTLTIERKAQDILLDKLAWGIGLVKLPWQEKFIYINW